ncbi:MAG: DUF2127 domain-containing protein [Myxococcaceae bacterium]
MSAPAPAAPESRADQAGLRLIIGYKVLKGILTIASGLVIGGALFLGFGPAVQASAARVHEHATAAWALHAAELLSKLTTPRWLRWSAVALELDGSVCLLEAWALRQGHAWGPWLVVAITALFLPADAFELWRHPRLSRLVLLLGNVAILLFLGWYAQRHSSRLRRSGAPPAPPTVPP